MSAVNPGIVAVLDSNTAGALVFWRLSGDSLDLEALAAAWEKAGLNAEQLPEPPSKTVAFGRAMWEQHSDRRMTRALEGGKGIALVDETAKGDSLDYRVVLTAKLDKDSGLVLSPPGAEPELCAKIWEAYERHQKHLTLRDVSTWLSRLIRTLRAVALRDTGGFYFVPREYVPVYRQIADAMGATSQHKLYEVPAMQSAQAVEAILDAVMIEAAGEAGAMETELDTQELGARALNTRQARCEDMREKLKVYEALLGKSLDGLHNRIESLEASITTAILAATATEEK